MVAIFAECCVAAVKGLKFEPLPDLVFPKGRHQTRDSSPYLTDHQSYLNLWPIKQEKLALKVHGAKLEDKKMN